MTQQMRLTTIPWSARKATVKRSRCFPRRPTVKNTSALPLLSAETMVEKNVRKGNAERRRLRRRMGERERCTCRESAGCMII